ncbi:uncharacterized protein BXZ73DRAFT_96742 [Epithele typhae]|uniref:uncharacterized protein n=1 Tax=Epithele typhae TaxID=378194 RepID=UPI00200892D8|nr:uncharacterized protein BXZ73DRAFT_96742 [Epithele typhae]KAH9944250.1 hypothetical protein BXZ73DRAFT_96742 [Epithele typhae]
MASEQPLTFNQAVRGVTEFIEVATHTIFVEGAITKHNSGKCTGMVSLAMVSGWFDLTIDPDLSFAILLELQDNVAPAASPGEDPPPWIPATTAHTTAGASDTAELHMIRAVDTGIINISMAVQESVFKLALDTEEKQESKGKGRDDRSA